MLLYSIMHGMKVIDIVFKQKIQSHAGRMSRNNMDNEFDVSYKNS